MPRLTPYVERLEAEVRKALAAWLGLGDEAELGWSFGGEPGSVGPITVSLRQDGRALQIRLRDASPEAPQQADGIEARWRLPDEGSRRTDPLLRGWDETLRRRFDRSRPSDGSSRALRNALQAAEPFVRAQIADRALRRFESSPAGQLGVLRLGFRCNQDCAMCFQGRSWPDPPRRLVEQWLEELASADVRLLVLTGGEPTIYSWLPELIERAYHHHGMEVGLQTNGVALARPRYLAGLVDAGLSVVSVALHSADPARSDRLTGVAGSHRRTVQGIRNALGADLLVMLVCCVEEATVEGLEQLARFVVDDLARPFASNPVAQLELLQPGGYHHRRRMVEGMSPLDRVRPPLLAAARALQRGGVPLEVGGACGFPQCVLLDAPELIAWRRRGAEQWRDVYWRGFEESCGRCEAASFCMGLREEYRQIHGARGVVPYRAIPWAAPAGDRRIEQLWARAEALRARRCPRARGA